MTLNLHASSVRGIVLTAADRALVGELADGLSRVEPRLVDAPEWVAAARRTSARLPAALREALRAFRNDPGDTGVLVIGNLPIAADDLLPPTPTVMNSVQRQATGAAAVSVMVDLYLGELVSFREEKFGALLQDVVPVPGREEFQGNAGSTRLQMHVENAFHPFRPDYLSLFCLRNDHDNVAALATACVRQAVRLLPEATLAVLAEDRYVTEAPASFGAAGAAAKAHAVLVGDVEDPDVRVDFASTHPLDQAAGTALDALADALAAVSTSLVLTPGTMALVDNRITLHGRSAFTPRYDGRDRWLQRGFVHLDLRRSRAVRPGNGNVLT
ncbi:TauD/TfdA family dioxygenase [Saccharothrix sp. Mg75]|uniref:TauD/TfdA family dioxygenase n=1 Tax=Saccharothrix sp. Mg75 TaxID=3445357 RepID=UPI003EE86243